MPTKPPDEKSTDERKLAFVAVYRRNVGEVITAAYAVLKSKADAQDVAAEIFEEQYRRFILGTFKPPDSERAWFRTAATNRAISFRRRSQHLQSLADKDFAASDSEMVPDIDGRRQVSKLAPEVEALGLEKQDLVHRGMKEGDEPVRLLPKERGKLNRLRNRLRRIIDRPRMP